MTDFVLHNGESKTHSALTSASLVSVVFWTCRNLQGPDLSQAIGSQVPSWWLCYQYQDRYRYCAETSVDIVRTVAKGSCDRLLLMLVNVVNGGVSGWTRDRR